jgi:hypothetical protein
MRRCYKCWLLPKHSCGSLAGRLSTLRRGGHWVMRTLLDVIDTLLDFAPWLRDACDTHGSVSSAAVMIQLRPCRNRSTEQHATDPVPT